VLPGTFRFLRAIRWLAITGNNASTGPAGHQITDRTGVSNSGTNP
jgi:hypothetical protein